LWQYAPDGELAQATVNQGEQSTSYCYAAGVVSAIWQGDRGCNDSQDWEFHPNGRLSRYEFTADEVGFIAVRECAASGWQTARDYCNEVSTCSFWDATYAGDDLERPEEISVHLHMRTAEFDPCSRSFTTDLEGSVDWDDGAETGVWRATDAVRGTTNDWAVERHPARYEQTLDENGNVIRLETRAEGEEDSNVHVYDYQGSGACRAGQNAHLARGWRLPEHRLDSGCPSSPVSTELQLDYYEQELSCD
jgi:hypothetical protein